MKGSPLNLISLSLLNISVFCLASTYTLAAEPDLFSSSAHPPAIAFNSSDSLSSTLPADSAFALNAFIELPNTIVLMWDIQDGYYLYRKSLDFTEINSTLTQAPLIPESVQITDEFFGEVEVYYERLLLRVPFQHSEIESSQVIELRISYQGCAEAGYCYPMQRKVVSLEIP